MPEIEDDRNLPHVRIYYTLEVLGKTDALHDNVYQAIQRFMAPQRGSLRRRAPLSDRRSPVWLQPLHREVPLPGVLVTFRLITLWAGQFETAGPE